MLVCSVLMFDDQSELCDGSVSVTPTTDCHAATVSDGQIAKLYQIFRYHTDAGAGGGGGGDPLLTQRQIYGVSRRQHLILRANTPGHQGRPEILYINVNHNHHLHHHHHHHHHHLHHHLHLLHSLQIFNTESRQSYTISL